MLSPTLRSTLVYVSLLLLPLTLAIHSQAKIATTTTLTSSPNPSTYKQPVTLNVLVKPQNGTGVPTGTVQIKDNGVLKGTLTLTNGRATVTTSTLGVGNHPLTATYSGDANFLGSISPIVVQVVNKASTAVTLSSAPNPSNYLQSVLFTASNLPTDATGSVEFDDGSNSLGTSSVNNGTATLADASLSPGSHSITATYSGDGNYVGSTSPAILQQVNAVLTSITVSPQGLSVAVGSTGQQYSAEGHYNDGTQQDITNSVTWNSSVTTVATISSGGVESPVAAGSTTISATLTPVQGTSTLNVYAANTFFVATNGNDSWSGTLSAPNGNNTDGPFASPSRAQFAVEAATKPAAVLIRNGTYYLALTPSTATSYPGTLILNQSTDSGTSLSAQVTWQNYPGEIPVFSGGVPANSDPDSGLGLKLNWTHTGNLYQATLPQFLPLANGNPSTVPVEPFESLLYNGERRLRARIHDTGTSDGSATNSVGYYMSAANTCSAIGTWPGAEFATNLASCNLGAFLRVTNTIAPTDALGSFNGHLCPAALANDNVTRKCLDRFYYTQSTGFGADTIDNWSNLTSVSILSQPPCSTSNTFPAGDVELTMFGAWTVDVVRVNCVDTTNHVIYLAGPTKEGDGDNYNFMGPTPNHRFVIENSFDVFNAAHSNGQTGIWFLDRHAGPGNWVLNYLADANENPATDNIVIPQLPQTGTQFPAGGQFPLLVGATPQNNYVGGSLIWATGVQYVTFNGITFEADNFYPDYSSTATGNSSGFANDANGEMSVPQAIDCQNCQFVTFNGITVRHTSASGILAGANAATPTCSTGSQPTTSSFCDLIENSLFYDIGDSGIRVGHFPQTTDTNNVVQDVLIQNNRVQGFSRVYPDGEGITTASSYNSNIFNNTVNDGYHAGISICFNSCNHNTANSTSDGNNILVNNNLISNLMQGITSDGGSLYFNVGGTHGSASGDQAFGNIVYNTTDSFVIDVIGGTKVAGSGYGGEGIYLDAETAGADVENNLVFNVDGQGIHITEGLQFPTETPNKFKNNLFAFANQTMFNEGNPWVMTGGCPTSPIKEVQVLNNLFAFDVPTGQVQVGRAAPFGAIQGCKDSCITTSGGTSYSDYQEFAGNAYWSFVEPFGTISNAFQVLNAANQGSGGLTNTLGCKTSPSLMQNLSFDTLPDAWKGGNVPIPMNEDAGGTASVNPQTSNPNFPSSGTSANVPTDFLISPGSQLGLFDPTGVNAAINGGAGSTVGAPNSTCSTATPTVNVCPTYPTFVYGSGSLIF